MKKPIALSLAALCLMAALLSGCSAVGSAKQRPTTVADYNDPSYTIAAEPGTTTEAAGLELMPDAKYIYVTDATNGYLAVSTGQADGFLGDRSTFKSALRSGITGLTYIDEPIGEIGKVAIGISPKSSLANSEELVNGFLEELRGNGVLDDMYERWVTDSDYTRPVIEKPTDPDKTVRIGTTGLVEPYTFYQGTELTGFELELIDRFALYANARVEISVYDWGGIVPACASGKVDYVMSDMFDTPERRESIGFSQPYLDVVTVLVVPDTASADSGDTGLLAKLSASFEKTFVTEGRWRMVLSGLAITLIISVCSLIVGTAFGFGLCALRRSKSSALSRAAAAFIRLIQGIPIVVLLMVLYYVVFASAHLSGVIVAVIAFSLNFGVNASEMIRSGIDAVDRGQWEASGALGFKRSATFRKVVLPQAVRHFLPSYKGEFIGMMKMTSVVGYITIQDLTKASDIIRSRTYEAFFPLITIAVIYFLLAWVLTWLIGLIELSVDPSRRTPVIHGVSATADAPSGQPTAPSADTGGVVIRLEHLKKAYPNVTPLRDVNADIRRGEVIAIIGPSGTGKSTLLRLIDGLEEPTDGEISVLGNNIRDKESLARLRGKIGMVFQNFNLFPHLTVAENIMLAPVELLNMPRQKAYERAMALLESVGLAEKALVYPDQLSGGQKQRVAIARTLAMDPEIILFDEPTSALDPTMIAEVLGVMTSLAKRGLTMLIVTHEMRFAREVATRVFYMDQGEIYEDGTPEQIFQAPRKPLTRSFILRIRQWSYEIHSVLFDFYDMVGSLEEFCLRQYVPKKQIRTVQLVVEELVMQTILPQYPRDGAVDIDIRLDCGEAGQELCLSLCYNGLNGDPFTAERDALSAKLLSGYLSEVEEKHTPCSSVYRLL